MFLQNIIFILLHDGTARFCNIETVCQNSIKPTKCPPPTYCYLKVPISTLVSFILPVFRHFSFSSFSSSHYRKFCTHTAHVHVQFFLILVQISQNPESATENSILKTQQNKYSTELFPIKLLSFFIISMLVFIYRR